MVKDLSKNFSYFPISRHTQSTPKDTRLTHTYSFPTKSDKAQQAYSLFLLKLGHCEQVLSLWILISTEKNSTTLKKDISKEKQHNSKIKTNASKQGQSFAISTGRRTCVSKTSKNMLKKINK